MFRVSPEKLQWAEAIVHMLCMWQTQIRTPNILFGPLSLLGVTLRTAGCDPKIQILKSVIRIICWFPDVF